MHRRSIVMIYSPLCEQNGAFLDQLEEWLAGKDIEIEAISFDEITASEREGYRSAGFVDCQGRPTKSVFIDVFFEGRLIDSVPLSRERIERALEIRIEAHGEEVISEPGEQISIAEFRDLGFGNELEWVPTMKSTYRDEMRMCLENHPYGNPPRRFHRERSSRKPFTRNGSPVSLRNGGGR